MSEQNLYDGEDHIIRLRVWALGQMVWGAFIAGAGIAAIAAILVVVWVIGLLLPEQSKQMPSPYGEVQIVHAVEVV